MAKIVIKTNELELVDNNEAVNKLYYTLAQIPSQIELDEYNKKHKTNFEINKIKETISQCESAIPLFDIVSQNIYLIEANQVFNYVKEKYYRIASQKIYDFLKINFDNTKSSKLKHIIEKNIKFLDNYNFDTLFSTYLKVIYKNSNHVGKNFTECKRVSFLPYLNNSPYYSRSEIINLALNLKIIKPDMTYYDNDKLNKLCLDLNKYDISSKTILEHQLYIENNNAQHIIYYYTFYGSQYYNKYLRNTSNIEDELMEKNIKKLNSLIKKSPEFPTDVYVYRFISSDTYLQDIRVNSIFTETSFISTSRNAFYVEKDNVFGNILLKIKLPKNKEGIGLCVETYSLFSNEQEILLNPGKLKLIKIIDATNDTDDFTYFHIDINAQKAIYKIYEFEYIEPINEIIINNYKKSNDIIFDLPNDFNLISIDTNDKIIEFYRSIPILNDMHYFNIGKYMFQVFYLNNAIAYKDYYFLLKHNPENKEIIFLVLQNPQNQEINLIIEIGDVISVNYLHKFTGADTLKDNELVDLLISINKIFKINNTIIHPRFKKYKNNQENIDIALDKQNEYIEKDILLNLSADLTMYNLEVINYFGKDSLRFHNDSRIVNKLELSFLDRLKRLSPELILKIQDTDELYRMYKKHKFTNISNMLLYLHENYFYLLPIFINKISTILKYNPFLIGYYVLSNDYSVSKLENVSNMIQNKIVNIRSS
jgi:hypothetical protein